MTLRLHATAALAALTDAHSALRQEAAAEAAHIAAEALDAPNCLRSPAWGRRHALGGHGDPTATAYLTGGVPFRVNRPQALLDDLTDQLARLAAPLPGAGAPLARIRAAIPTLSDRVLGPLTDALGRLDTVARRHLRMQPARQLIPVLSCPACTHIGRLEVTTAGPEAERIVTCGHCRAAWLKGDVVSAVAGAAPTHTTT